MRVGVRMFAYVFVHVHVSLVWHNRSWWQVQFMQACLIINATCHALLRTHLCGP